MDAFPVAGGQCFLLSLTFGNFGLLCKTSCLHFIAAIATCGDKDRDIVYQVLAHNFAIVDSITRTGQLFIKVLGKLVAVTFAIGADDQGLRLITGLAPSSSNFCCFYCYFLRNLHPSCSQCLLKRSVAYAIALAPTHGGHEALPLLRHVPWDAYKMCILHALMSMGRVFCNWLFDWLGWLEQETHTTIHWDEAQAWLSNMNVNINITKPPTNHSWNCKGIMSYLHSFSNAT